MVIVYAFVAVLCLGLAPFFGKTALGSVNPLTAFAVRTVIAALLMLIWILLSNTYAELSYLPISFWVIVSVEAITAAVLGDLAYFYALDKGSITEVSLVMSCAPLVTLMLSHFIFGEMLSVKHVIGALLVTAGLIVINFD